MLNETKICVVIPCFNAVNNIAKVIRTLPAWVDQVIAVNDASTDDTLSVLQNLPDPRLTVLSHEKNRGVGGAMKTGYTAGLQGKADIFVKMDSDGQMDPAQIRHLLGPILSRQANFTKGNRFLHAKQLKSMPFLRRVGNFLMSFLSKAATGYWNLFDPTNGFTAITRSALEALDFDRLAEDYYFETSMLAALYEVRAPIKDVGMKAIYQGETSHLDQTKVAFTFPFKLLGTFFRRLSQTYFMQDFNVVSVFLVVGTLSLLFGLTWGIVFWVISSRANVPASTGTVMIAVLPLILGIQLLLEAVVLDVQAVPKDFIDEEESPAQG